MKLLFITNMPSYHQMELAENLAERLGVNDFRLAFLSSTSSSREEMGWGDNFHAPFVLRCWESAAQQRELMEWISSADVVVQGRCPIALVRKRIYSGKLTFAYQERFWKRPVSLLRFLGRLPKILRNYWTVNCDNYHLLAAGAYVASDLNRLGCFSNRSWRFGYFINPSTALASKPLQVTDSPKIELLWCGRFYGVKQPLRAVDILHDLVTLGVDARLTMIGDGELRQQTEEYARSKGLLSRLVLTGWQPQASIERAMRDSHILLMTSQQGEGWALVVNEAMRNACVVVCDAAVGSAPWLIEHAKTGFIYTSGNLSQVVKDLAAMGKLELEKMGREAQARHDQKWSAPIAAQRLIDLSEQLLSQSHKAKSSHVSGPVDGPCSSAL